MPPRTVNVIYQRRQTCIDMSRFVERVQKFANAFPNAVLVLNSSDGCIDICKVLNNGGDTEHLAQLLLE